MISKYIKSGLGVGAIIILVIAFICVIPVIALWCINNLAEAGGSSFYIEHSLFNYFVAFVAIGLIRGN